MGIKIAMGLARGGFGEDLRRATQLLVDDELRENIASIKKAIAHELMTNEQGLLDKKAPSAAGNLPKDWLDPSDMCQYFDPVTSFKAGYEKYKKEHTWDKPLNVGKLARLLENRLSYSHRDVLQK